LPDVVLLRPKIHKYAMSRRGCPINGSDEKFYKSECDGQFHENLAKSSIFLTVALSRPRARAAF
jgi:hypothetical protein